MDSNEYSEEVERQSVSYLIWQLSFPPILVLIEKGKE